MPHKGLQSHPPIQTTGGGGAATPKTCPPGFILVNGKCVQDLSKVPKSRIAELPVGSPERGFFIGGEKVSRREFEIQKGAVGPRVEREEQVAEEREIKIREKLGTAEDIEELTQKIVTQPDLAPTPIGEVASQRLIETFGLKEQRPDFPKRLITGKSSKEEIINEAKAFAIGVGIVAGTALSFTFIARGVASKLVKDAANIKILSLKGVLLTLGATIAGGGLLNYDGLEMNTMRKTLSAYTEDGEKLQILAQGGLPIEVELEILRGYADEVDETEAFLKRAGVLNIRNLIAKDYIEDMSNIRTAREAILKRIIAIDNLAITGRPILDPQEIMWMAADFAEGEI